MLNTSNAQVATVQDLVDVLEPVDASAAVLANVAREVVFVRTLDELERAGRGAVVVLDEPLEDATGGYRFDLALGRASQGIAAIVVPRGCTPSITAQRLAHTRGISLARLRADNDIATVSALLERVRYRQHDSIASIVHTGCELIDDITTSEDIPATLEQLAALLGTPVQLNSSPETGRGVAITVLGVERAFLRIEIEEHEPLLRALRSHLVQTIERVMRSDHGEAFVNEATRTELINEFLLGDASTSADSASRLRRSGHPIDDTHIVVRLDCHELSSVQGASEFGVRQRITTCVSDQLRATNDEVWARAGTGNSILVIGSSRRTRPEFDRAARLLADDLIDALTGQVHGLELFVGISSAHAGADGLPQAVVEATTAARSAQTRGAPNVACHIDRLGLSRALVHWSEIDGVKPLLDEILEPLEALGQAKADTAIETLRVFLDCGRNVNLTAQTMHIHRNTARYRIERISNALQIDIDDADERLLIELACRVRAARQPEFA